VDLEELSDQELERLHREFHELRSHFHTQAERATEEVDRRRGTGRQHPAGG
jgi:hypothetical protein